MNDDLTLRRALIAYRSRPLGGGDEDLWPQVTKRFDTAATPPRCDVVLGIVLLVVLCLAPQWLWYLAYHL